MATDVASDAATESDSSPEPSPPPPRFSLRSPKVRTAAILVLVAGVQTAIFYFWVPQPSGTAGPAGAPAAGPFDDPSARDIETVEVKIDDFNTTNNRASQASDIQVTFTLHCIVARDQEVAFDQAANRQNRAMVRESVQKVWRSSSLEDLNDPDLSVIKRKIREEINKVLRKSYVIQVVISGYRKTGI